MHNLLLASALLLCAPVMAAELRVEVLGLRSSQGDVGCILYRGKQGFPTKPSFAVQKFFAPLEPGPHAACVFKGLEPGEYAAAVYHDENGNHRLDLKLFGIPAEGVAVTRDAPAHFGPPRYEDARVQVPSSGLTVHARMRY